jgi:hypothetical protein
VPQDVAESCAQFEARFVRENGFPLAPEARQRILNDWTLDYYDDGEYIASRHTHQGAEVVAVGCDEAHQYRKDHPPKTRPDVRIGTV